MIKIYLINKKNLERSIEKKSKQNLMNKKRKNKNIYKK